MISDLLSFQYTIGLVMQAKNSSLALTVVVISHPMEKTELNVDIA